MKMDNVVHLTYPAKQEIEFTCRYDRKWKCYFLSILVGSISPEMPTEKVIFEEVTICLNDKKELNKFKELIEKVTKKVRK